MSREDGGPAFPVLSGLKGRRNVDPDFTAQCTEGMSLRDYFAGMALQGMIACPEVSSGIKADFAEWAFGYADAMLEARKK